MIGERTSDGWSLRVRPEGVGRFGGALFLCVWLCGWAFGEIAVLSMLVGGAYSVITGNEVGKSIGGLAAPASIGVGAFLLVWVTGWTFGGIAAIGELLRLLSSEDVLTVGPGSVTIARRRGPFRWTRAIEGVRGAYVAARNRTLGLEPATRRIAFAPLPASVDSTAALAAVRRELHLPDPVVVGALPEGWEELVTPEGDRVVTAALAPRRKLARILAGVALPPWLVALALAWLATNGHQTLGGAVAFAGFASVLAGIAVWLDRTRSELKIGGGQVVLRRRVGRTLRPGFQVDRLELNRSSDSDGDAWYKLEGVSLAPADPTRPRRRTIAHALHDPFVPRALGTWLASRAGVPLRDEEPGGSHGGPGGL